MKEKPEAIIEMVNWLDKTLLSKEMGRAIKLCVSDMQELQRILGFVNDYEAGKIKIQEVDQSVKESLELTKSYSDEFHNIFIQVKTKVTIIVVSLILATNAILLLVSYRVVRTIKRDISSLKDICLQVADCNLENIHWNKYHHVGRPPI